MVEGAPRESGGKSRLFGGLKGSCVFILEREGEGEEEGEVEDEREGQMKRERGGEKERKWDRERVGDKERENERIWLFGDKATQVY